MKALEPEVTEPNNHKRRGRSTSSETADGDEIGQRLARIECLLDGLAGRETAGSQHEALKASLDQMSDRIAELGAGFGRIDRDMVVGLASMVGGFQRLDLDITGSVGQISTSLAKVADRAREIISLKRRLDEIHISLEEILGRSDSQGRAPSHPGQAFAAQMSSADQAAAHDVLSGRALRLHIVTDPLPEGIAKRSDFVQWRGTQDVASPDPAELPRSDAELLSFVRRLANLRSVLRPGDKLLWLQPLAGLRLSLGEAEQILGLVAAGDLLFEHETGDGERLLVACGTVRREVAGLALRWSLAAMSMVPLPAGEPMLSRFTEFGLSDAIQCLDLPEDPEDANWEQSLKATISFLSASGARQFGVCVPAAAFGGNSSEVWDPLVGRVVEALDEAGCERGTLVQWVRGPLDVRSSPEVLAFAERNRVALDLTPVSRRDNDNGLSAFDDERAYRPLSFDLRLPGFVAGDGLRCAARHSGRRAVLALGKAGWTPSVSKAGLSGWFFEERSEALLSRLEIALDREKADEYTDFVNKDLSRINYWAEYNVYNWAPPPRARLACFEFDAYELLRPSSPVSFLAGLGALSMGRAGLIDGRSFVETALGQGDLALPRALRDVQILDHAYLKTQRPQITGDGLRLIEWLPQRFGETLEIGSGFGVLAREIRHRTDRYVGYDLSLDQAFALRDLGCEGIVGDMNLLPFPAGSFDTVLADNVVEHSYDPLRTMREVNRVLRAGGRFFLILPLDYLSKDYQLRTHLWKADTASILSAAEHSGFNIVRYEPFGLAEAGVRGAFPSCRGMTSLWELTPRR